MDPVSLVQSVVGLCLAVKQIADDMSSNKSEGKELASKIQRLVPLMETLQSKSASELNASQLGPSLDHLAKLLEDAGDFLEDISPPKGNKGAFKRIFTKVSSTANRAWNSAHIVAKFVELNNKFDQILIELSAKEVFKLAASVDNMGAKLNSGFQTIETNMNQMGAGVGDVKNFIVQSHAETMNAIAGMQQVVLMILQSGGTMESFLRSSNAQAQETISKIMSNSERLVKLAEEDSESTGSKSVSSGSQGPSSPVSAPNSPSTTAALALLLLVDFAHLMWNKNDRGSVLGSGSFGTVYKCTYMGQECALKHFDCLDKQKPTAHELNKIKKEAMIMQLASLHCNIIGFRGANIDAGILVMEFAHIPLYDLLHRPEKTDLLSLSADQKELLHGARWKISMMLDIARALTYIHTHKILHRDLKTPNVLLVYDLNRVSMSGLPFVAKVSDFGLASAVGMSSSGRSAGTKRDKGAVGSAPYMAPELLDFDGYVPVYTSAVDMYAFGILCNELLTEKEPWLGLQEVQITRKVADKKERPVAHVPTCAAEEVLVSTVIGSATSRDTCCLHHEAGLRPTASSLCSGDRPVLPSALSLCVEPLKNSMAVAQEVLNKIDDTISCQILGAGATAEKTDEEERQRKALAAIEAKRLAAVQASRDRLRATVESKDIAKINALLQETIQAGFYFPEVEEARSKLESLMKVEDIKSQLQAAIKTLEALAVSGINASDLLPLAQAIAAAEQIATVSGNFPELDDAVDLLTAFEKHANAKADLEKACASKEPTKLRAAVEGAQDLGMQIDVLQRAKDLLKEMKTTPVANADTPYDAAEEARQMRQEIAKQARFDVKNFPNLRTADDFARGAILNQSQVKEEFLSFQLSVVPKSLTNLNREDNTLALQIHKDLLGYMGDKQLPFPAMLAQDILRKGYESKPIRDEIYMLIIKQLSNNPRPESVAKGWQVMCMCVGTFPPSPEFENFLLHYIIEKRDRGLGAVVDYARYCLRTLEAMLNSGDGTGWVPAVEEILAYKERPPILATIHLVDGNVITENLPLTPDLNVAKVLEMCAGWLDLKDSRISTLGMFVYDLGGYGSVDLDPHAKAAFADLKRTPRPLRNEDYMGDTIVQKARQRRKFKFVLKRKLFLPKDNYRGEDPFFERITYLQLEDEVVIQGNLEVPVEEAQQLAAISMAVAFGEEMPDTVEAMVAANVDEFVPPNWRKTKSPEEWASIILQFRDGLIFVDPDDLQDRFLQIVQKCPAYGSHWFYCHKLEPAPESKVPNSIRLLPNDLLLGFNIEGMSIYTFDRVLLLKFPYPDICRWGGSFSQFSLIMADDETNESYEFVLVTSQAADMAAILLDHIRANMAEPE